jgi:hypothetical protein
LVVTTAGWLALEWVVALAVTGFSVAAIFSSGLRLERRRFVLAHVLVTSGVAVLYVWWDPIDIAQVLLSHWEWGVIGGVVIGILLSLQVRSQAASARSSGPWLFVDLSWLGVAYGTADSLLLSVLPVLAVAQAFGGLGAGDLPNQVLSGATSLGATALVTVTYHLGFGEFRNRKAPLPVIATGLGSFGMVVSLSPLAAIVSHCAMHLSAVIRGPERTLQLPPHY